MPRFFSVVEQAGDTVSHLELDVSSSLLSTLHALVVPSSHVSYRVLDSYAFVQGWVSKGLVGVVGMYKHKINSLIGRPREWFSP